MIPNGLVHVTLDGFDDAPAVDLSTEDAIARRDAVERRYRDTYLQAGHERWFFHAFDDHDIVFVVARWEPDPRMGGRYVAVQRVRIANTLSAERAFGIDDMISQYTRGVSAVKADMSPAEVEAIKGKPESERPLGPYGAFDWVYADQCIRFLEDRVAYIRERSACGP